MKKLLLILFTCKALFAWTPELYDAVISMEYGQPTKKQQGLILKHKAEINEMRMKGVISNKGYQAAQNYYDKVSIEIAKDAAHVNGAKMDVQKRTSKVFDAGTDSDFITNATSKEQVRGMQKSFNEMFEAKIKSLGVKTNPNTKWHVLNDVDFMVDPANVSQKVFEEIAKENNDAYKRRAAAEYEKKVRSGKKVNLDEIMAYNEEMQEFVQKKRGQAQHISNQLQELEKDPRSKKKGTQQFIQKQRLEADLHLKNAHEAKYYTRMVDANEKLASMLEVDAPASSSLPKEGKLRSNTMELTPEARELQAKKQKIKSALVNASNKHLMGQQKMNQAVLLSIQKGQFPNDKQLQASIDKKIKALTTEFTPSQMGEFMEKTEPKKAYKKTDFSKPKELELQKPKLDVSIFDAIAIYDSLEKAQDGEHLLINFYKSDSAMQTLAKAAGVALIELSPIPVVDALQNSYAAEDRVKRGILRDIAEGKAVSPALALGEVYAETAVNTFGNMFIKPSLDLLTESVDLGSSYLNNWEDSFEREANQQENEKRLEAYEQKAQSVKIGIITTEGVRKSSGRSFYVFDDVRYGDKLYFMLNKNDTWLPEYTAKWEIWKGSTKLATPIELSADQTKASYFRYENSLPEGEYEVYFRIFGQDGKQINFTSKNFTVIKSSFGMSDIMVLGDKNYKEIKAGDKLNFFVEPEGGWNSEYTVEWFLDGSQLKSIRADKNNANNVSYSFDDYISYGKHKITVRAIDNQSGKILTSKILHVTYPKPEKKEEIQEERKEQKNESDALSKYKEKMANEAIVANQTTLQDDFNYLDELFGTVDDMVDWTNEQREIQRQAYAKIERLKAEQRAIDRENAEFWKGFGTFMQAMGEGVREYQKQKYAPKKQTSSSTNTKDDWSKKQIGLDLSSSKPNGTSSSSKGNCMYEVMLTASNRPADDWSPSSPACDHPQSGAMKVTACGKTYYLYNVSVESKYSYDLRGWMKENSENYYLDLEDFGKSTSPLYDGIKVLNENKKTICQERKH